MYLVIHLLPRGTKSTDEPGYLNKWFGYLVKGLEERGLEDWSKKINCKRDNVYGFMGTGTKNTDICVLFS